MRTKCGCLNECTNIPITCKQKKLFAGQVGFCKLLH